MFTPPETPAGHALPEEIVQCRYRICHRESPEPRHEVLDPPLFAQETRRTPQPRNKRRAK